MSIATEAPIFESFETIHGTKSVILYHKTISPGRLGDVEKQIKKSSGVSVLTVAVGKGEYGDGHWHKLRAIEGTTDKQFQNMIECLSSGII